MATEIAAGILPAVSPGTGIKQNAEAPFALFAQDFETLSVGEIHRGLIHVYSDTRNRRFVIRLTAWKNGDEYEVRIEYKDGKYHTTGDIAPGVS